jgi:hypothetical protein
MCRNITCATGLFAAAGLVQQSWWRICVAAGPGNAAILSHGTAHKFVGKSDSGLIYGDYYFLVALARCRQLAACHTSA